MRHTTNINTKENNNLLNDAEDEKFLMLLCKEKPYLIIRTEFGLGKYKFIQFSELQGNLVLKFNLLDDKKYKDTQHIHSNIGEICFLSIPQYLYVYGTATA